MVSRVGPVARLSSNTLDAMQQTILHAINIAIVTLLFHMSAPQTNMPSEPGGFSKSGIVVYEEHGVIGHVCISLERRCPAPAKIEPRLNQTYALDLTSHRIESMEPSKHVFGEVDIAAFLTYPQRSKEGEFNSQNFVCPQITGLLPARRKESRAD